MEHTHGAIAIPRRPARFGLAAVGRFARHLLEMIVAMLAGMLVLGVAIGLLGTPPGYEHLVVEYAYMALAMSVPMVAWMRRMGHPWSDGWEMVASMVVPMFALVVPTALGLVQWPAMALMGYAHLAMIGGMIALMLVRWDRYANGAHCHTPAAQSDVHGGVAAGAVIDPVCGMAVDPATAARSAEYQGRTYYFCAPGCRKAFEADPAQYLAPDYAPSM